MSLKLAAEIVFWACVFLVLYTYFLYPIVLFFVYSLSQVRRDWYYVVGRRNRRVASPSRESLPLVSIVVAAHNEEEVLPARIENLRQLQYPAEKLEILFVSDGSADRTNEILREAAATGREQVLVLDGRGGKSNALNRGVAQSRGEILVLSDASTMFAPDAIEKLVRHFGTPQVGVVCGALQFQRSGESKQTEGVYWHYESMLRLMESRLGATLTASGAIYAVRRECFQPLSPDVLIDDFVVPMYARKLGYRVLYDPEAMATEIAADSVKGEFHRRVRLAIGSFRALPELLRVPMQGFTGVAFWSHKFLRWVVPFFMIGLLVTSGLLLDQWIYKVAFAAQLCFYVWAICGVLLRDRLAGMRYALVGYFLLAMNLAFLVGFFRSLRPRRETTWERVR
jgi:cellulose synthase/poly-beta-1,6-N-acetylglucosamine synthase-like glycosyltransferase